MLTIFCSAIYILKFSNILCHFIAKFIIAFLIGVVVSQYRCYNVNINALNRNVTTEIQGTISAIKPSTRGENWEIVNVHLEKTLQPLEKIKLSVGAKFIDNNAIGDKVKMLAKLYRPSSNNFLSNFDCYSFDISATGYGMSQVKTLNRVNKKSNFIYKVRKYLYDRLLFLMGKEKGNFTAAILLGETKGIDRTLMQNIRLSGISHILCVSGLHLSLVVMLFFVSIRFILNCSSMIAHRYNIKKSAAIIALIASYVYLELSGRQIAATRAFIMSALVIIAIIISRQPHPMRAIGLASTIILALNPEYAFHPSFQLSFIAVLSLIGCYEFYTYNQHLLGNNKGIIASVKIYAASNIYCSFLASVVTAPVVINQFFIFSTYSIPMNLIAVPIMSFFLMPLAILLIFAIPFGLDNFVAKILTFFIEIIIRSSLYSNSLPHSVWYFGYITPLSLNIFLFGFFWLCIWKTKWRYYGIIAMTLGFILMLNSPKPSLIFDFETKAVGLYNAKDGLKIHGNKISGFVKSYWANWYGQADAPVYDDKTKIFTMISGELVAINYGGKCADADIVINASPKSHCSAKQIINYDLVKKAKKILLFCDKTKCEVKYNDNIRFKR